MKGCNVSKISIAVSCGYAPPSLVGLNISQNALVDGTVDLGTNMLRSLNASDNNLTFRDPGAALFFQGSSRLLALNLSGNPIGALAHLSFLGKACPQLRNLQLESCGIKRITSDDNKKLLSVCLSDLAFLLELNLSSNDLCDTDEARALAGVQSLASLYLGGSNPLAAAGSSYESLCAFIVQRVSRLQKIDGIPVNRSIKGPSANLLAESMQRSVALAVEDSASCSCKEGNPCAVAYNCSDWENRFAVAKAARLEKYDMVF